MNRPQKNDNYTTPCIHAVIVSMEGFICSSVAGEHSATTEEWETVDL